MAAESLAPRRASAGPGHPEAIECTLDLPKAWLRIDWRELWRFRDLLLVLAYFGYTYEFMWAGAVGVMLFFALMLHLGKADRKRRIQNEQTFQPHRAG